MHGWKGRILNIDLSSKKTRVEEPPVEILKKYIGGKGLAGYYLKKYVKYEWYAPEMPLLFMTGPLNNTPSPTSGRICVMSRSPLTGTIGDASVGGKLGINIKRAGYDGICIKGQSLNYCGIEITDSGIRIFDAEHLKGKSTSEIHQSTNKNFSSASIGPAAENGAYFSNIMIDGHYTAGRNGLGLVMASKKLKFITVYGSQKTEVFDKQILNKAKEDIRRLSSASPALEGELGISNYGTGALYDLMDNRVMMPTNNFRKTLFPYAKKMNSWNYKNLYNYKKTGCPGCHILCKKKGKNKEVIPEFETMSHFSALIENTDIETVVEANRLCNEYGLDTITTAVTLATYKEITGKNLGKHDILNLISDIALNKGDGKLLKFGSYRYALENDHPECSMTVKRQELPGYDPRGAYGMALAYATSTRGGCHLRAYPITNEILRKPVVTDRFSFSGKARIIKLMEDINAAVDSLTACKFLFFAATLEEFATAFYGVTGIHKTSQDLMTAGERIYYNERIMNAKNGFSAKDDDLPSRFFEEEGSKGEGIEITPINRNDFLKTRSNYYKIRGLSENGEPLTEKIKELELDKE